MLGQLRNEIGKQAVASSCDSAADEELVAAAKKGDELGFESLAKRHQRTIFAFAFRYTRVREDAEDIVQETFQRAFVHLQKFEGKSSVSTWLTRVAINEALMSLRRRRALHEVPADDSSGDHRTTPGPDRERAFEIPIYGGGIHGCDLDDWLQAERELQEKLNKSNDGGSKKK